MELRGHDAQERRFLWTLLATTFLMSMGGLCQDVDRGSGDLGRSSRVGESFIRWNISPATLQHMRSESFKRQFSPWGGKRGVLDQALPTEHRLSGPLYLYKALHSPRAMDKESGFNPWGGKREDSFNPRGGKKEDKNEFSPWGGKREQNFNPWGGKKTIKDSTFSPWGGKREGPFNPWGGKKGDSDTAFAPWGGKRDNNFNPWGGKRDNGNKDSSFSPWGGKRESFGVQASDAESLEDHSPSRNKRDSSSRVPKTKNSARSTIRSVEETF
ncbi:hypothetical protein HPB47_006717 [Ixodes persulcatus]|uniref:Uncharacterized protein n=1 Tax=Ixodes persulcatus TaxID=34615 RepID=A0AC60P9M2_IXOPE|nr:hypothetical protein HPB47_006717 [Ixodes persulcatus]